MKRISKLLAVLLVLVGMTGLAQPGRERPAAPKDSIVEAIIKEATENSQLEKLGHELMDGIGPRLVGSPKMQQAHDGPWPNIPVGALVPAMKNGVNGADGREAPRTSI
jgi:hypothetical protein